MRSSSSLVLESFIVANIVRFIIVFTCDHDQYAIFRKILHFAPNHRTDHEAFGRTVQFKCFTLNAVVENELTGGCNRYDKLAKPPVSMAPTLHAVFGVKDVVDTLHWEADRIILYSYKASSIISEWKQIYRLVQRNFTPACEGSKHVSQIVIRHFFHP